MATKTTIKAQATKGLTALSHGAGCACKLSKAELEPLLEFLPRYEDPAVLVDSSTADDAGVYLVRDDLALVQSADFFTPIVDDPYHFGRIACANALSDIYAMGARPVSALNLVAYSVRELGDGPLRQILKGGADMAAEAGVAIVGGHSIDDREPKYGLAVTGVVDPGKVIRNSTARPGDTLFLTKPIGCGAISTAAKRGNASQQVIESSIEVMTELNRDAAEAAMSAGPSAMTDVTGFGLLGHLHELAHASGLEAVVYAGSVPIVEGALELITDDDNLAGGSQRNREFAERWVSYSDEVPEPVRRLLNDAMTSGGLLIAASDEAAQSIASSFDRRNLLICRIGYLREGQPGKIEVLKTVT